MARQLKEIRNFNVGNLSNADLRDSPDEASVYAENVDPNSPGGILEGRNSDILKGDDTWYSIISVSDNGGNAKLRLSSALHGMTTSDKVTVVGTNSVYDGTWTITAVAGVYITISKAYTATATGFAKVHILDSYARLTWEVTHVNMSSGI